MKRFLRLRQSNKVLKNKTGYILVELLVVIVLFGCIFGAGALSVRWIEQLLVRAELDKFLMVCYSLQQRARATGKEILLTFDQEKKSYHFGNQNESMVPGVYFAFPDHAPTLSNSTLRMKKPITFVENKISFYPSGIVQAGTVCFSNFSKKVGYALSSSVGVLSQLRQYAWNGRSWKQLEK